MWGAALAMVPRPVLLLAAVAGAALAGAQTWRLHTLHAEVAQQRADQAEAARMAQQAARAEEQRRRQSIDEVSRHARTRIQAAELAAADARAAADSLRQRAHAAATAGDDGGPGPADGCAPATGPGLVLADLLGRAAARAADLAAEADRRGAAGAACEAAYRAVTLTE